MQDINILIVGVGGQGTLLASKLLGNIACKKGLDVKLSEVHGMAQRGGSVVTHVRMSEKTVYAPIIGEASADVIVAFELLEGYRWLPYLKEGGKMLVNTQKISPMTVLMGAVEYPSGLEEKIKELASGALLFDAETLALAAGSEKAVNTVMLGALAKNLPFEKELWLSAIKETVKPQFVEMNLTAFESGYDR